MIPMFKVHMAGHVAEEVSKTLNSGFISQGAKVDEFESALCEKFEYNRILTVNSATSGLTLALRLLKNPKDDWPGIMDGDEVLSTALTCTATNFSIVASNMKIKWVDVDPTTCNIDILDIEKKLSSRTKVIMVVHWGGTPMDLGGLENILDKNEKKLGFRPQIVQDCAHAFMAKSNGKYLGTCGKHIAVYSLQAIKHLTSGDGGLMFLPTDDLYTRAKLLRWYGIDRDQRNFSRKDFRLENDIPEWGYKYHMNDINATIGLCNLKNIDSIIESHRRNARKYSEALALPFCESSSYWIYTLLVEDAEKFIKYMKDNNVTSSQVHKRNDVHSCLDEFKAPLPQLNDIENKYVCVPVGWWLSEADVEYISTLIKNYK